LRTNKRVTDPKVLLREYGFTPLKALHLLLFSIFCSALGIVLVMIALRVYFYTTYLSVKHSLADSLISVQKIYHEHTPDYADALLSSENLKFPQSKQVGPKDLNLNNVRPLIKVKGQKRKISDNVYEVRFIAKDSSKTHK